MSKEKRKNVQGIKMKVKNEKAQKDEDGQNLRQE